MDEKSILPLGRKGMQESGGKDPGDKKILSVDEHLSGPGGFTYDSIACSAFLTMEKMTYQSKTTLTSYGI
jgi:hypothetical protein